MGDAEYPRRSSELLRLFEKFDRKPTLLLDLACGTGGFSIEMAKNGISVIGADISPEMLSRARENALAAGEDILFLCQDAADLDLYGTVDGAICCLDSVNHITDYSQLCRAFERVSLFLEKDRLFIFDANTVYKQECILGDNVFVIEEGGLYCVWSNEYDTPERLSHISLDFFEQGADGRYERTSEEFSERAYTDEELISAAKAAGLEMLAILGEFSDCAPDNTTERAVFITRKV